MTALSVKNPIVRVSDADVAVIIRDGVVREDGDLSIAVERFFFDLGGVKGEFVGAIQQAVTDSTTNFVFLNSGGTLSINTTGYPGTVHIRLARVITSSGVILKIFPERAVLTTAQDAGQNYTAGENLLLGDLLSLNTSGEVIKADATFANSIWELMAVANSAVTASSAVGASTAGKLVPVLFGSAPAGSANGSIAFLSTTPGEATLTPPVGAGVVIFVIGVVQGADGITTTPTVQFQPQYISRRP